MRTAVALLLLLAVGASGRGQGVAFLTIDLRSRTPLQQSGRDQLDQPIAPGSVIEMATLAAALESGVIDEHTTFQCTREVVVRRTAVPAVSVLGRVPAGSNLPGYRLTCVHPDLRRPLTAAEALAHSCHVFFATVGERLPRPAFDRVLAGLGLPLTEHGVPVTVAALGIEGIHASPRALIDAVARIADEPSRLTWKPSTLAVVREGLRGAAHFGSATRLSARGVDALAEAGTTPAAGAVGQGIVVGVTPSSRPSVGFVLLAPDGAGADAAALVADRLAPTGAGGSSGSSGSSGPAGPRGSGRPGGPPAMTKTVRIGIARPNGGYDVRTMNLEDYVAGVIAGEAARDSSPAALQALAITVRTFALANLGRHRAEGFDLCDLTHCQVLRKPSAATTAAAEATSGRVLLHRGAPASIFFTASCGGHTERPSAVWPGADDPDYLPARGDDACEGEPAWSADLTASDLMRALRSGGFRGDVREIRVTARNDSGRAMRLRLEGLSPVEISGQDLRTMVGRTLGWQFIKSTMFEVHRTSSGYHFSGHGSGHGVGLCVIGSAHLAARGQTSEQILARYFPGVEISAGAAIPRPSDSVGVVTTGTRAETGVIISLPAGDEGERDVITALVIRSRDSLAKQLGVAPPERLALRFHPTVESYQRATAQQWFTAGATVRSEMHFVPLTALRDRGLLDETVRREVIHVLTGPVLANRPLWVREGAASYFAGERTVGQRATGERSNIERSAVRGPCPTDEELRNPVSPGALQAAYARATACFARQMAAGKKWSAIK
jgi:stage II sporulation protein D